MPIQQAIALHSQLCAMTLAYWGCSLELKSSKASKKVEPFSAFYLAVGERLMTLARLLIDLHPAFLREKWLWQRDWPVSLYRRPMVRQWLLDQASTPRWVSCVRLAEFSVLKYTIVYHICKFCKHKILWKNNIIGKKHNTKVILTFYSL